VWLYKKKTMADMMMMMMIVSFCQGKGQREIYLGTYS